MKKTLILSIMALLFLAACAQEQSVEKIKVGAVLPLSGFGSFYGSEMQKGLDMCNAGNIQFIYEDSASAATTGVTAYTKLTQIDKADITIVTMSAVAEAVLPIAKQNKDFVLASIVSGSNYAMRGGETVFRYFTDGGIEAEEVSAFLIEKFDAKKAGILFVNNDYGMIYKTAMEKFFKEKSLSLVSESFSPTEADFATQLLKLKEQGVEYIFIVAYDKQTLQAIKQAKELGINAALITSWFLADPVLQENNKQLIEGVYFTTPEFYLNTDKAVKFNGKYKDKYGKNTNIYATIGCDLSNMIGNNGIRSPEQLEALKAFDGINGNIPQGEGGEFIFPIRMAQFVNGTVNILS